MISGTNESCPRNKLIPLKMYLTVTQLTAGRLEDKASQVRKSAIQLLTQVCQYNPYSAQLRLSQFEDNYSKLAKTIKDGTGKEITDLQEAEDNNEITEDEARFLKLATYYGDGLQFIREIHRSVPIICELLGSKNASDVLEAIQFFVTATSFNVEKARDGLRKMLMLVWSKENNIREALLKAYVDLYLTPPVFESKQSRKLGYLFVAKNLISLTIGATLGELTSMEELLFLLMKEKHVSYGIVEVLWEIFGKSLGTDTRRTSMLTVLQLKRKEKTTRKDAVLWSCLVCLPMPTRTLSATSCPCSLASASDHVPT